MFSLLRFFDELFDVINGDPFLTLYKTSANYTRWSDPVFFLTALDPVTAFFLQIIFTYVGKIASLD